MTDITLPNREDAQFNSQLRGLSGDFYGEVPDPYYITTSGGGDSTQYDSGIGLESGGSNGDTSILRGIDLNRWDSTISIVTEIFFHPNGKDLGETTYNNSCRLGHGYDATTANERGVFVDLKEQEVYQGGSDSSTEPISVSAGSANLCFVRITRNANDGETTFYLNFGGDEEEITLDGGGDLSRNNDDPFVADGLRDYRVSLENTGESEESIWVQSIREYWATPNGEV